MIVRNFNCDGELIEDLSKVNVSDEVKMIWQSALRQVAYPKEEKITRDEDEKKSKRTK
ncbi:hypothetical protein IW492_02945 [Enterococcus sp. BWB1-3]|uniref:hypothetical protein n=1 Tax=Enterococcus sp. BWB1-3 TaxID=2787713 RepID=UPI0019205A42|nr:hypothetical protein [Enterococcus sp. BWB1-3]MBL1228189.1 hypothetical protein [Enterococcus sp. BWB1-3]